MRLGQATLVAVFVSLAAAPAFALDFHRGLAQGRLRGFTGGDDFQVGKRNHSLDKSSGLYRIKVNNKPTNLAIKVQPSKRGFQYAVADLTTNEVVDMSQSSRQAEALLTLAAISSGRLASHQLGVGLGSEQVGSSRQHDLLIDGKASGWKIRIAGSHVFVGDPSGVFAPLAAVDASVALRTAARKGTPRWGSGVRRAVEKHNAILGAANKAVEQGGTVSPASLLRLGIRSINQQRWPAVGGGNSHEMLIESDIKHGPKRGRQGEGRAMGVKRELARTEFVGLGSLMDSTTTVHHAHSGKKILSLITRIADQGTSQTVEPAVLILRPD